MLVRLIARNVDLICALCSHIGHGHIGGWL